MLEFFKGIEVIIFWRIFTLENVKQEMQSSPRKENFLFWRLLLTCKGNKIKVIKRVKFVYVENFFMRRHHHHYVVPLARISLTFSHHFSQSFIASGRSSGLHPVSSQSCCVYVRAGRPAFARPYVGVHSSTSLMNSSLLLQQCPACLVRLTWIVFVMGGRCNCRLASPAV